MSSESRSILIIDDLLEEDAWTEVWTMFQFADFSPVTKTKGAWKLDDGVPLGSAEIVTPGRDEPLPEPGEREGVYPSGTALDHVLTAVLGVAADALDLIGDGFESVTARAYAYPRGTALSWHSDDSRLFDGAFVYYAHPHWNAHWGGELLVADDVQTDAIMGHRFDDASYSDALMERGAGRYVAPKPNRLVLLGGAPHAVTPVRAAAGAAVRATVSGFFLAGGQDG